MNKFHEQMPMSVQLDKEYKKIPESGAKLSAKVDNLVMEIKKTKDKTKKQKMLEELLVHVHPLLGRAVSNFYKRFYGPLSKQGVTKEDIYNEAVESLIKCVDLWEDQATRKSQGEVPAHFTAFFFNKFVLPSRLKVAFVNPVFTQKRSGYEVSLNQPLFGNEEHGSDLQDILSDEKAENAFSAALKKEEIKIGRDAVLNKLYSDKDPLLSLIVMLRFGFNKGLLDKWKIKFNLSVKGGKIGKVGEKYIPKIDQVLKEYQGEEMTLQEIGSLLDVSREYVRQRVEKALNVLES